MYFSNKYFYSALEFFLLLLEMEDLENLKNDQILHCLSHILFALNFTNTGLENLGLTVLTARI